MVVYCSMIVVHNIVLASICLVAETTDGVFYGAESISNNKEEGKNPSVPADGRESDMKLLDEIYRGGCCDSPYQWLFALFMILNISKFLTGPISTYTIHFLQNVRDFLSITFKLENPENEGMLCQVLKKC